MIFNIKTECLWETALLYKAGLVIPSEWCRYHSEGFFCSTIVEVQQAETAKADILNNYGEGRPTALTKNIAKSSLKQYISPVKPDQVISNFFTSIMSSADDRGARPAVNEIDSGFCSTCLPTG